MSPMFFKLLVKQFPESEASAPRHRPGHLLIHHGFINLALVGVVEEPLLGKGLAG